MHLKFIPILIPDTIQLYGTTKIYFWNADTPWGGFITIYDFVQIWYYNVVFCFDNIILIPQDFLFTTIVTPHHVIVSKHGWYYMCCDQCLRSIITLEPPFKCNENHTIVSLLIKYGLGIFACLCSNQRNLLLPFIFYFLYIIKVQD